MVISSIASTIIPAETIGNSLGRRISAQAVQAGAGSASTDVNNVNQAASSCGGVTALDLQSSVDGINAQIEDGARTVWSRIPGITPDQIAASENARYKILQAAEGATIACAVHFGIKDISFDFDPIDATASSSATEYSMSEQSLSNVDKPISGSTSALSSLSRPSTKSGADVFDPIDATASSSATEYSMSEQSLSNVDKPVSGSTFALLSLSRPSTKSGADVAIAMLTELDKPSLEASENSTPAPTQKIDVYA